MQSPKPETAPLETTQASAQVPALNRAAIERTPAVQAEPVCTEGLPIPLGCNPPWAPPGIAGPWPHDEYLEDGGDRDVQVNLGREGEIRGLELEDTVAIFDTADGVTIIKPSNRVCLYAPRFAAVRKVTGVAQNLQNDQPIGVQMPVRALSEREEFIATTAVQPVQPVGGIGTKQPSIERVRENAIPAISGQPIAAIESGLATYENLRIMRQGVFEESEKARLMEAVDAAITWSHDQAVQVILNEQHAVSLTTDQRAQVTFSVEEPIRPCLRVIKVASRKTAQPGDIVDFTIRFDNLGDQVIRHVVLMDNLTTRLEYVAGSAQSSRSADFSAEPNEGDSVVLRWDFVDPLPVGQGGLVRFHCRVR
jgi:uncharacterized repeat protein (TIGR01451 family)